MSTRKFQQIEILIGKNKGEAKELIDGLTRSIDALTARVAVLEQNGDAVAADPPKSVRAATIPERPSLMRELHVGKDPKAN
jgi:hypothetical protein